MKTLVIIAAIAVTTLTPPSVHARCPRGDALGTSRVLEIDPATAPRVGLKSFPQTLPLADREVVLTFDDGPFPGTTTRVLAALARECVQATFFLIGKNAAANAALVKRIAADGHSIGHHSLSHPSLLRIAHDSAVREIDLGIAADELALNGKATTLPSTPFFRFPGFEATPALLDLLQSRRIAVFGTDIWASDWNPMTPQQQFELTTARLSKAGRGIILFHDTKAQTAAMLPEFLRYLRIHNYRVVHMVPAAAPKLPAAVQ